MRKVCVVVTARPSYSRVKTAMRAIREHPSLELQVVVAASALLDRYGRVERQIEEDGFHIDARVYSVLEGENPTSMAKTTGIGLVELATVFEYLRPDVVVTVADRFETLATAVAASYSNIPVAHIQGGEVTGSIDERVRHAVTKLSDIHFPSTVAAGENIIRMGEPRSSVFVTGCPSIDLAAEALSDGARESVVSLTRAYGVGGSFVEGEPYILVMMHPVTTEYDSARAQVTETLEAVRESARSALWFWPNGDAGSDGTSAGIRAFRERYPDLSMHFVKNFPPNVFIRLLSNADAIVGNSSVAIREGEFLGVPAVNIGTRQSGRERGNNVLDVEYSKEQIKAGIEIQASRGKIPSTFLYGDGKAGERIAAILAECPLGIVKKLQFE